MKKIHRFLLPPNLAHQIRDVLKMEQDEEIELMDGAGMDARAIITNLQPDVEVEVKGLSKNQRESLRRVVLYCSILKKENFELVVQKATEVGVSEIVPVISARTIKTGLKLDRLQKITAEAAEQSGRGIVPIIHEPMTFKVALIDAGRNSANLFFDTNQGGVQGPRLSESVGIFIGPEGGWSDEERKLAEAAGCEIHSLGPLVMRGETAAIIATYLASTIGV